MKYVALLRGINVGGKSLVKMSELKVLFEKAGYENVSTYINSGNIIFEEGESSENKIGETLEKEIAKKYKFAPRVVVVSASNLKNIIEETPTIWKKKNNLRMYVGFMIKPKTPMDVVNTVKLKDGIDSIKAGKGVVYMSTKLSGLTRSGFTRMAGTAVYRYMTIRNFNTVRKLHELVSY